MADVPLTVRERIMAQLERKFRAMNTDTYTLAWNVVTREPLERYQRIQGDALSIIDLGETFAYEAGYIRSTLRVLAECWYKVRQGDVPSTELNRILGDVLRLMLTDLNVVEEGTNAQLALDVKLVQESKDLDGPLEHYVSLVVEFSIQYRFDKQNPATLM